MPRRLELLLALALLVGLFLSLFLGAAQMGLAYDELFHIPAGATFVASGVRRSTTEHTPLGHLLTGLALTSLEPYYSRVDYLRTDFSGAAFDFGYRFFRQNEAIHGTLLAVARLPLQLAAVLGAAYCWMLGRSLWGRTAGFISLLLVATCPLYVAWSRYVYLDGLLAATMIVALSHLIWFLRTPSRSQLVFLSLALGACATAKYSGAMVPPLAVLLILLPSRIFGAQRRSLAVRLRDAGLVAFGAAVFTWIVFGCPADPQFYVQGYRRIYSSAVAGYRFYFMGSFAPAFWYFYPALFTMKSTLPTLLGVAGVLVLLVRERPRWSARELAPVVVLLSAALLFLGLTSYKSLPIGARYLTPMYPPLYVCIGWLAGRVIAQAKPWPTLLVAALVAHHVTQSLGIFPDEMAYFNQLWGGPGRGIRLSNDASLDAGQHLPRLARYLQRRGNPPIKLHYQGTDVPERYGIRSAPLSQAEWDGQLEPGLYAISSYRLVYGMLEARQRPAHLDWLGQLEPKVILGHSIYVYEIPSR
jgi:hypothetical protein